MPNEIVTEKDLDAFPDKDKLESLAADLAEDDSQGVEDVNDDNSEEKDHFMIEKALV